MRNRTYKDSSVDRFAEISRLINEDVPLVEICRILGVTTNTAYFYIHRMINAGLVKKREVRCPYELTEKGRAYVWGGKITNGEV